MEADLDSFPKAVQQANMVADSTCQKIARIFSIEELAVAALTEGDDIYAATEPREILALRKESK